MLLGSLIVGTLGFAAGWFARWLVGYVNDHYRREFYKELGLERGDLDR